MPVPSNWISLSSKTAQSLGSSGFKASAGAQVEVKTRILNGLADWESVVPKTLDILRYCGGRITPSCGHHLHIGLPEFKADPTLVRSLWNLIHRFEQIIFGLVAPSRRGNSYCQPLPPARKYLHGANAVRTIKQRLSHFGRYYGLNLTHLWTDSPRVELRMDPARSKSKRLAIGHASVLDWWITRSPVRVRPLRHRCPMTARA